MRQVTIPIWAKIVLYILAIALGVAAIAWYAESQTSDVVRVSLRIVFLSVTAVQPL
jgi:hypothetical protein